MRFQSDASGRKDARKLSVPQCSIVSEDYVLALQVATNNFSACGQGVRGSTSGWCKSAHHVGVTDGHSNEIMELRRITDLAIHATKETARAIGWSMAAMVAAERHLWLTMSDIKDKDRVFILDAMLAPLGLFGNAIDSIVDRH